VSIAVQTVNGVARIAIARPEKKNAITGAMYQAMADAIGAAHDDAAVRAILIHGEKDVFTAGNDLEDFMKNPPSGMDAPVFQFMQAIGLSEKPVIAAVNGAAVGIGTTMLMHCDLVYCADNAMFSMPFVSLGVCSEFASSLTIPLAAGYHKAAEKLLLAEPISAEEALEMKIVNRILPQHIVLGTDTGYRFILKVHCFNDNSLFINFFFVWFCTYNFIFIFIVFFNNFNLSIFFIFIIIIFLKHNYK